MDDFDEMVVGFATGLRQYPPEAKFVATDVYIPLDSIRGALGVLGVAIPNV